MIKYTTAMKSRKDIDAGALICETVKTADAYEIICKLHRSCYEVISDDIPVCLYADIDSKHDFHDETRKYFEYDTQHFIDFAKNAICKAFMDFPDCTPRFAVAVASSADFMTVEGKRKFCHSIHIHIPNKQDRLQDYYMRYDAHI